MCTCMQTHTHTMNFTVNLYKLGLHWKHELHIAWLFMPVLDLVSHIPE